MANRLINFGSRSRSNFALASWSQLTWNAQRCRAPSSLGGPRGVQNISVGQIWPTGSWTPGLKVSRMARPNKPVVLSSTKFSNPHPKNLEFINIRYYQGTGTAVCVGVPVPDYFIINLSGGQNSKNRHAACTKFSYFKNESAQVSIGHILISTF